MLTVFLPKDHINLVLMENATKNKLMVCIAMKTENAIQITVANGEYAWDGNVTIAVLKIVKELELTVTVVFANNMNHKLDTTV